MSSVLASPAQVARWTQAGLATDGLSAERHELENVAIMMPPDGAQQLPPSQQQRHPQGSDGGGGGGGGGGGASGGGGSTAAPPLLLLDPDGIMTAWLLHALKEEPGADPQSPPRVRSCFEPITAAEFEAIAAKPGTMILSRIEELAQSHDMDGGYSDEGGGEPQLLPAPYALALLHPRTAQARNGRWDPNFRLVLSCRSSSIPIARVQLEHVTIVHCGASAEAIERRLLVQLDRARNKPDERLRRAVGVRDALEQEHLDAEMALLTRLADADAEFAHDPRAVSELTSSGLRIEEKRVELRAANDEIERLRGLLEPWLALCRRCAAFWRVASRMRLLGPTSAISWQSFQAAFDEVASSLLAWKSAKAALQRKARASLAAAALALTQRPDGQGGKVQWSEQTGLLPPEPLAASKKLSAALELPTGEDAAALAAKAAAEAEEAEAEAAEAAGEETDGDIRLSKRQAFTWDKALTFGQSLAERLYQLACPALTKAQRSAFGFLLALELQMLAPNHRYDAGVGAANLRSQLRCLLSLASLDGGNTKAGGDDGKGGRTVTDKGEDGRGEEDLPLSAIPDGFRSSGWQALATLERSFPAFAGVRAHMASGGPHAEEWAHWLDIRATPEAEHATLPGGFLALPAGLPRLLLLRCCRPDRFASSAEEWLASRVGSYDQPPLPATLALVARDVEPGDSYCAHGARWRECAGVAAPPLAFNERTAAGGGEPPDRSVRLC